MAGISIKNAFNAVVSALQAATSTHLAGVNVYKGDNSDWKGAKAIFVMWTGSEEEGAAIGNNWWMTHRFLVEVRQVQRDSTGAVADGDWYDDFLELCEEVNLVFSSLDGRSITDANSLKASHVGKTISAGYGDNVGKTNMLCCQFDLTVQVDMPTA